MRASVDVGSLTELAGAVGVVGRGVEHDTAPLEAGVPVAAPELALAVAARRDVLDRLRTLRSVVALAAEGYAATEARVAQLVGTGLQTVLGAIDPAGLEALLVAVPALAGAVVGDPTADPVADALTRTLLLPPAAAARAQAQALALLGDRQRRLLALAHPRLMTALAGAPTSDRVAACRVLVAADLAALLRQRNQRGADPSLDARIAVRQRLLDGQVVLRHPDGTTTRHPHQLLAFDPAGDGRVIEVLGDLSRARHLAVFVPGTGSDLSRLGATVGRMTPFAAADPALAVVVWQNADHPDQPFDDPLPPARPDALPAAVQRYVREGVLAAAYRESADVAGPVLAADVAGLRVALPAPAADLTVLGHSYGGSIVGSAEAHGMVVDRVVHVASAGGYVGDVRDYADPATARFSMTAYDDPIRLSQGHDAADASARARAMLPAPLDPLGPVVAAAVVLVLPAAGSMGHGLDPDLLPGVVRLDTGVHPGGGLVRGHSDMFAPDSTAWRNLLAVMTRGRVEVLQPQLWSSHLDPLGAALTLPGGGVAGGTTVVPLPPRYVVDASPWSDPAYRPPTLDLR